MTHGRLIAVVGPSGVGKDSVMAALAAARPDLRPVRRVITRPAEAGGEDHQAATVAEFDVMAQAGAFALHWRAHGLRYGIPIQTRSEVIAGADRLANLSRAVVAEAFAVFPALHVLAVTAAPDVLAKRLADRGRETPADIAGRLARAAPPMPQGVRVTEIDNSGALDRSVDMALAALYPVRA